MTMHDPTDSIATRFEGPPAKEALSKKRNVFRAWAKNSWAKHFKLGDQQFGSVAMPFGQFSKKNMPWGHQSPPPANNDACEGRHFQVTIRPWGSNRWKQAPSNALTEKRNWLKTRAPSNLLKKTPPERCASCCTWVDKRLISCVYIYII